jgi:hypothetical protein
MSPPTISTNNNDMLKKFPSAQLGGKKKIKSKKKNGHKDNCKCPICINMKYAKKGGAGLIDDYDEDEDEDDYDVDNINDEEQEENEEENDNTDIEDMEGGKKKRRRKKRISLKKGGDIDIANDIDTLNSFDNNTVIASDADYEELEKSGGSRKKRKSLKNKTNRRKHRKRHKTYKKYKKTNSKHRIRRQLK